MATDGTVVRMDARSYVAVSLLIRRPLAAPPVSLWTATPRDRFVDMAKRLRSQPRRETLIDPNRPRAVGRSSTKSSEVTEMTESTHEWLCEQIVDNAGDAVIFGDAEGRIKLWNAGAESIFGFRADEIVGKSMDLIIPENLRERHWEGYEQTMKTGRTQYSRNLLAVPALRKDGTRISIEFTIALIRDKEGKLLGPAAILRDVTSRWNQDKELRKRVAALEAKVASSAGNAKAAS
jgi:PAS domain S-box-containing protein